MSAKGITKSALVSKIAETCDLPKKKVSEVLDELISIVHEELKARRPIVVPGIAKIMVKRKPAKPARQGRNPKTGETMMFKAKPAHDVVKARLVKALKDAV